MRMKKILAALLCVAMVTTMLGGCGSKETAAPAESATASEATETADTAPAAPAADAVTLKIGYGIADTTTMGKAVQTWADQVTEKTDGRIVFEIYPSGQLGSMTEIIEAVDLGQLDIALGDSSLMSETVPQLNLLSLPMLIKDFEGWKTLVDSEVGEELKTLVADNTNFIVLGWAFNGFREIITSKEVNSLDDCKGIVIRSPEADIYIQTLQRLNFTPTALSFSEVYTALQTGVVEACETSYEQFIVNSFYEEANQLIESNHMAATMSILINKGVWEGISAEDQAILQETYDTVMRECDEAISAEGETFKNELLEEKGCKLYTYTDEEQAVLVERFEDYWSEAATASGFEDLLTKAIELR